MFVFRGGPFLHCDGFFFFVLLDTTQCPRIAPVQRGWVMQWAPCVKPSCCSLLLEHLRQWGKTRPVRHLCAAMGPFGRHGALPVPSSQDSHGHSRSCAVKVAQPRQNDPTTPHARQRHRQWKWKQSARLWPTRHGSPHNLSRQTRRGPDATQLCAQAV